MENKSYIKKREKLIPAAARVADAATKDDPARKDWDRIFINEMDALAVQYGLQEVRYHPFMAASRPF